MDTLKEATQLPNDAIPLSFWISIAAVILVSVIITFFWHRRATKDQQPGGLRSMYDFMFRVAIKPLTFLLSSYLIYVLWNVAIFYKPALKNFSIIAPSYVFGIIEFIAFFWLAFNVLTIGKRSLWLWAQNNNNRILQIFIPAIGNGIQAALFFMMLTMLVSGLHFTGLPGLILAKAAKVFLIAIFAWIFLQVVNVIEQLIIRQYQHADNLFTSRKITTQVMLLKRVVIAIGLTVMLAAMLMVFDSVKNIGTGLLTTAGIVSAVGAFASQKSLGRLFAGLQIAFTQPIRIGDTVIIENEFGEVEEITLSYIIVKLWDLRRLILPTDYFTSKGLLNLTRNTTQLLGTIFFYTDFTLPIDTIRRKFNEYLAASQHWDGKVSGFEVTEIKENAMQIRALVSAENSSALWKLRCEVREKIIKYIAEHHPECLSKSRTLATNLNLSSEGDSVNTIKLNTKQAYTS